MDKSNIDGPNIGSSNIDNSNIDTSKSRFAGKIVTTRVYPLKGTLHSSLEFELLRFYGVSRSINQNQKMSS